MWLAGLGGRLTGDCRAANPLLFYYARSFKLGALCVLPKHVSSREQGVCTLGRMC